MDTCDVLYTENVETTVLDHAHVRFFGLLSRRELTESDIAEKQRVTEGREFSDAGRTFLGPSEHGQSVVM